MDSRQHWERLRKALPTYSSPVFIRKVKILNKPTFKLGKLIEFHYKGNSSRKALRDETGDKVEQTDGYEPRVQESA